MKITDPTAPYLTVLICATDPGGARNISPVAAHLKDTMNVHVLCSERTKDIFSALALAPEIVDIMDIDAAGRIIRNIGAAALVVGTSAPDRPEAMLTRAAQSMGLPTIAVLDEWYYYAARFANRDGNFTHLPDIICCQDELARNEALAEGLPLERLQITGSPALAETFARLHNGNSKKTALKDANVPTFIFVSEQIAKAFGETTGDIGFVGPFIGYTEKTVRNDIADVLSGLGTPCCVLEKLHPNETGTIAPPTHNQDVRWTVMDAEASLSEAMQSADAIIGMRSIALLEGAMMGFRPASYQPDRIGPDQCTAARLGLAASLSTQGALKDWLKSAISGQRAQAINPDAPTFATPDATRNVCNVITALIAHNLKNEDC